MTKKWQILGNFFEKWQKSDKLEKLAKKWQKSDKFMFVIFSAKKKWQTASKNDQFLVFVIKNDKLSTLAKSRIKIMEMK